jgi:hypothetical protein
LSAFDHNAVQKNDRIDIIKGAILPGFDLLHNALSRLADKSFRDIDSVHIQKARLNITHAHTPGVHSQYLVVEAFEVFLSLGDKLRLEARVTITRRLQTYLFRINDDGLLPLPLRELPEFLPLGSCLV